MTGLRPREGTRHSVTGSHQMGQRDGRRRPRMPGLSARSGTLLQLFESEQVPPGAPVEAAKPLFNIICDACVRTAQPDAHWARHGGITSVASSHQLPCLQFPCTAATSSMQ